ncbi:Signal transduction histidine kinase [Methylophaga frappieri]|uniref:histidine kinase n=1 Tax=Methylophaga frappieri (strain ATCC BAA-2434 / DSM 25690 / JAM7) TaxID=754477 RepID=I1YHW3_METFJ|nr:HAMP domain-containing sensor histidine kinase [Methylophaga frappieri]AFJ02506.1 Signal transduction histidine kinase [Methylophaga frappieri]
MKNHTRNSHYHLNRRISIALIVMVVVSFVIIAYSFFLNTDGIRRVVAFFEARILTAGYTADSELEQLPIRLGNKNIAYTLYDTDGKVLWMSENLHRPLRYRPFIMNRSWLQRPGKYFSGKVLVVPAYLADGTTMMVAKEDLQQREILQRVMLERLFNSLLLLIPLSLIALATLIPLLLLWILKPVRAAARVAETITPSDKEKRIPDAGLPREIMPLVEAANQALERLMHAVQREKVFVADAAHELRTPLTILDLHIQELQNTGQTDIAAMLRQRDQMRLLVEQLLSLARHEHQQTALHDQRLIDMADLIQECIEDTAPLFASQQRQITFDCQTETYYCVAEYSAMMEVVTNVLSNALHHGKGETEIRLTQQNGSLVIEIQDAGTSLPVALADSMFSRFKKQYSNTPGTGLGLAIARQIVRNNGGEISFVERASTCLQIRLPAALAAGNPNVI